MLGRSWQRTLVIVCGSDLWSVTVSSVSVQSSIQHLSTDTSSHENIYDSVWGSGVYQVHSYSTFMGPCIWVDSEGFWGWCITLWTLLFIRNYKYYKKQRFGNIQFLKRIQLEGSVTLTTWHPLSTKVGTNVTYKRLPLGRYSLLTERERERESVCVCVCVCVRAHARARV
jgi:hypothetical protein